MLLLGLFVSHKAELRADLRRYYGLDLHDLPAGYGMCYVADLAAGLPYDSACHRASDPSGAWGYQEYLLAGILNRLSIISYQLGGGKGPRPAMVEAPKASGHKKIERVDMDGYLARLKALQRPSEGTDDA